MQRYIVIAGLLAGCLDASLGTATAPLLVASGPTASEVLGVVPALHDSDRRPLDCRSLLSTEAGTLACTLLVACALPPGVQVSFEGLEFAGEAGIAPRWRVGPITRDARREVTACLLAHLSEDGLVAVPSLRGRRLVTSPEELAGWTLEEGAFFGDLMADHPVAVACRGVGGAGVPQERSCAVPDPGRPGFTLCGLAFAGECPGACGRLHGPYRVCSLGRGEFNGVVTAFVER